MLLALEAKLVDKPKPAALHRQLRAQRALLDPITAQLGARLGAEVRLVHAALLPAAYPADTTKLDVPILTWEKLRDEYADVAPRYFHALLDIALRRHPQLVATVLGDQEAHLTGAALVRAHRDGNPHGGHHRTHQRGRGQLGRITPKTPGRAKRTGPTIAIKICLRLDG